MKRLIAILLTSIIILSHGFSAYAISNVDGATKPLLSSLSYEECLLFLDDYGIEIPDQLKGIDIKYIIQTIESNPDFGSGINWTVAAEFFNTVSIAIQDYHGKNLIIPSSTFALNDTLEYSTVYAWDSSTMGQYNCYSYALGITSEW